MRLRDLCSLFVAVLIMATVLMTPAVVLAESYDVSAQVMAPLPPEQPVMLTPGSNTTQTTSTILITGTCPIVVPALIVVLLRDGETIGSGSCDSLGVFRISVSLVLGVNTIYAKFMTITGESGGVGDPITITYMSPGNTTADATPSTTDATPKAVVAAPLTKDGLKLIFDYDTVIIKTKETTNLEFTIKSGKAPYKVVVDWGDGSTSIYNYDTPGSKSLSHIYAKIFDRPMRISLVVTDAAGTATKQERAIVSYERPTLNLSAALAAPTSPLAVAIWTLATVVSLAAVMIVYKNVYKNLAPQTVTTTRPIVKVGYLARARASAKPKPRANMAKTITRPKSRPKLKSKSWLGKRS